MWQRVVSAVLVMGSGVAYLAGESKPELIALWALVFAIWGGYEDKEKRIIV